MTEESNPSWYKQINSSIYWMLTIARYWSKHFVCINLLTHLNKKRRFIGSQKQRKKISHLLSSDTDGSSNSINTTGSEFVSISWSTVSVTEAAPSPARSGWGSLLHINTWQSSLLLPQPVGAHYSCWREVALWLTKCGHVPFFQNCIYRRRGIIYP